MLRVPETYQPTPATDLLASLSPMPGSVQDIPAISPADAAVLDELKKLNTRPPGWGNAIGILVVSLIMFAGTMRGGSWDGVFILLGVLFFHELGHYVAMRCFNYRNVRMFFIPFFGAAVTGRHYNVAGWKKAVVALAGPVPGIVLAIPLAVAGVAFKEPTTTKVALMLLILNGFNLLPFLPLDGGWVAHGVLFVRHPSLDVVFRVLAAIGLGGVAVLFGDWILIGLAVFMLVSIPGAWRIAQTAHQLRERGFAGESTDEEEIPDSAALAILAELRPKLPPTTVPKVMAGFVANVFSTVNAHPPSALASIAILTVHAGTFLTAVIMTFLLILARELAK
jgi:Zn-dependent protease